MDLTTFTLVVVFSTILGTALLSRLTSLPITAIEIVAGIALANFLAYTIPDSATSLVTLGSLLIVFLAGFETNLDFLKRHLRTALLLGVPAFALPCLGLFLLLTTLFHAPWLVAMIGAAALADTSISIVYTTLQQYDLASLPFGRMVLASTLVVNLLEDATVTTSTSVVSPGFLLTAGVLSALLLAALVLPRLARRIPGDEGARGVGNLPARSLLLSVAILSALSTLVRVPGILFVFLMGLFFSRYQDEAFLKDARKLAFAVFVPLYFLAVGLKVEISFVLSHLLLLGVLVGAATLLKVGSLWFPARRAFGPQHARPVVVLMNTRLTSATVILLLAVTYGLISEGWYSLFISSVVILALGSSLALKTFPAFAHAGKARQVFAEAAPFVGSPAHLPGPNPALATAPRPSQE
jgi:Kef-type K+ transport system membrane component KefB